MTTRKKLDKNCEYCGSLFKADPRNVKRGGGRFCNLSCAAKFTHQSKPILENNCVCKTCGKEFRKTPARLKKSRGFDFCSRECKDKAQRLVGGIREMHPSHYNDLPWDYRNFALSQLPQECSRCGYSKYIEVLEVHHKDRDRENRDLSNLEIVCPTCHKEEHFLTNSGWYNRKDAPVV